MTRISYLDGHRGVAILLVVMFHAFSRWSEVMPYGDQFDWSLFRYGHYGVQLFFLISGFVILMTLEKSSGPLVFLYRRWLRLFPAMLICSVLIFVTAGLFTSRPNGQPELIDLIAGISFVDPDIWRKLTGLELKSIEGVFWSLYVEVKFYVLAAIFYYLFGSKRLVWLVLACYLSWVVTDFFLQDQSMKILSAAKGVIGLLSFKYFGWFAAGAAFYISVKEDSQNWFLYGVLIALFSSVFQIYFDLPHIVAAALVALFFAASIKSQRLQTLLSNRVILFFGFISYPLYLLHENAIVSSTIQLGARFNEVPAYLFPLIAIGLISFVSYFVSRYFEPTLKRLLSQMLGQLNFGPFKV